jgi:hypothetical protein
VGLDGTAGGGRRGDQAHFPHAGEGHVEGAGDGGGAEGEHIHLSFEGFDFLLLIDAKPLFFIHHQQPQVFELHGFAQQLMGAHHHIQFPGFEPLQNGLLFLGGAEAVQQPHLNRIGGKALLQGVVVLLGEDGGGGQQGHLFFGGDRFEDGPYRHLGFAKAHVAAHQTIHGAIALHVQLHILHRLELIRRGLIGERVFQLLLPGHVGGVGEALQLGPLGVELQQIHRHLFHGFAGATLGFLPGLASHFVQHWHPPVLAR